MSNTPEIGATKVDEGGSSWKLPSYMGLSFAFSVSLLCIMSTVWKHHWELFAVSLCGPIAMGVSVPFLLKIPADLEHTAMLRDQAYRALLILACVYVVTYAFFYAVVQLLMTS